MSNSTWENCNLQSGAVLWLRHSFARAFYWGLFAFLLGISCLLIASLTLAMTEIAHTKISIVIASEQCERGNQTCQTTQHVRLLRQRQRNDKNSTCKIFYCHVERKRNISSLRASTTCERGKQQATNPKENPDMVNCHETTPRNDERRLRKQPKRATNCSMIASHRPNPKNHSSSLF